MKTPTRYFCLRSKLEPSPSRLPAYLLGLLALITVVGTYVDLSVFSS